MTTNALPKIAAPPSNMPKFTFSKSERLKSEKRIGQLFRSGHNLMAFPLRVVWLENTSEKSEKQVQIAISVPKRTFKTAVQRNRIKRQIREAWRLHKHKFYEKWGNHAIDLILIYVAKEPLDFEAIEKGVQKLLKKFSLTDE